MKRFLVVLAALYASTFACNDDPQSHVFVAAQYDVVNGCFGPSTSLGYVDTAAGSLDCAPTCLVLSPVASEKRVYVLTMCGPYPAQYDSSQTDPSCAAAIAAWPAEQTALGNGTNSCASPAALDGGEDGGATDDGGAEDGGSDAGPGEDGSSALDASDGAASSDAQGD